MNLKLYDKVSKTTLWADDWKGLILALVQKIQFKSDEEILKELHELEEQIKVGLKKDPVAKELIREVNIVRGKR